MNYSGGLLRQHTTLAVYSSTHTTPVFPPTPHGILKKISFTCWAPSRKLADVSDTRNSTFIFQQGGYERPSNPPQMGRLEFYSGSWCVLFFPSSCSGAVAGFRFRVRSYFTASCSRNRITRVPKMCRQSWLFFVAGFAARDKWLSQQTNLFCVTFVYMWKKSIVGMMLFVCAFAKLA